MRGGVAIVGCGPGAADLLTLRAIRVIESADVVLHDSLVTSEILSSAKSDARLLRVGRRAGEGGTDSAWVGRLMVREARSGASVARLHGGDPSLFGRMSEEVAFLREARIPFEVVPGITASLAAAAALKTPLTSRGVSASAVLVAGCNANAIHRAARANPETVVFYMAGREASRIAAGLIAAGRGPRTPAALVSGVSLRDERRQTTTLEALALAEPGSAPELPVLLLVGEVLQEVSHGDSDAGPGRGRLPDDLDARAHASRADVGRRVAGRGGGRGKARARVSP